MWVPSWRIQDTKLSAALINQELTERWTPEQSMQMKAPRVTEAHRGSFLSQSAQNWFSGINLSLHSRLSIASWFVMVVAKEGLQRDQTFGGENGFGVFISSNGFHHALLGDKTCVLKTWNKLRFEFESQFESSQEMLDDGSRQLSQRRHHC